MEHILVPAGSYPLHPVGIRYTVPWNDTFPWGRPCYLQYEAEPAVDGLYGNAWGSWDALSTYGTMHWWAKVGAHTLWLASDAINRLGHPEPQTVWYTLNV